MGGVTRTINRRLITFATLLMFSTSALAQSGDSSQHRFVFRGTASITNNGFSIIPAFSLGKPAGIVTLYASLGKRFSFEPEFRYSLKFKPWSFVFIWRYKVVNRQKFQLTLGTHLPTLNFITKTVYNNGVAEEVIKARRFFPVLEFAPNWIVGKRISIGALYQYGRGLEPDVPRHGHFATLRAAFNHIPIASKVYFSFTPQLYYLKLDEHDGYYANWGITLGREGFPLAISSFYNLAIDTDIPGNSFEWNISLVYFFGREFLRVK